MTDTPETVVIPYSRFLECKEKRRTITDHTPPRPPTSDADVPPVPQHPPVPIATVWRTP